MNDTRYQRQTILPEIGREGQKKLARSSVLCVGAGGLGCPALLYLTAAGIGHIGIVDDDKVELSNLQRQVLFSLDQIGKNKAEAAKEKLEKLNPDTQISSWPIRISADNIEETYADYDIVLDATDNFETKFLLNDAAVKFEKPLIYASILGFEGQVSIFNGKNGPCYRCLFSSPPQTHIPNCAEAGIIGALAGTIGSIQALEAIKIIINHPSFSPLIGKFWTLDARTMVSKTFLLNKNASCPTCSPARSEINLQPALTKNCSLIRELSPSEAISTKDHIFIDVREQEEWDMGHIENAHHLPLSKLMQGTQVKLPEDKNIILYCHKGIRSLHAAQILQSAGYSNISSLRGGYESWLIAS